jgi:negative regulator of sigma E activity
LIGECLRGNLPQHIDPRLADRISNAIVKEPAILAPSGRVIQFFKPALGFAIAASVTVVAILGVRQASIGPVTGSAPVIAERQLSTPAYTVAVDTTVPVQPEVASFQSNAEAEARLNRYLVNYNEHRTNAGMQGMLPYVRIVAHEVVE